MMITEEKNAFISYSSIERAALVKTNVPLLIVLCPNYEDRSQAVSQSISHIINKVTRPVSYLMICLKNKKNNDMILEDLKETNINGISLTLNISDESIEWLDYPNNFTSNALRSSIERFLNDLYIDGKPVDALFDISTMPRSIIFHLCENITKFIAANIVGKIYFAYSQPQTYSKVHYAQDVGTLKGLFSGRMIEFNNKQSLHAVVFPSRTGHEGKLLCDSLDNLNRSSSFSIYFPIHATEFNSSLDIMRANQSLLDREAYNSYFYCTLQDAIKELNDYFNRESLNIQRLANQKIKTKEEVTKQTYLVAPFGAKIFMPIAYFGLLRLKDAAPQLVNIEICHVKGFQYTSVYSTGIGTITCFELEVRN